MAKDMKDQLEALRESLLAGNQIAEHSGANKSNNHQVSYDDLQATNLQLVTDINHLHQNVHMLEVVNGGLSDKLSSLLDRITIIETQLSEKTNQNSELANQLDMISKRSNGLEENLIEAQSKINTLLDKATALTEENTVLGDLRDQLAKRVVETELALEQYAHLRPRLDELGVALEKSKKSELENAELKKVRKKDERKFAEIESELTISKAKLERAVSSKKSLSKQLKDLTQESVDLVLNLKKLRSNESRLNKRLEISEALNSVELRINDPFTVEWIVKNAIVSRDYQVFFGDPKVLLTGDGPWDASLLKETVNFAKRKTTSRKDKSVEIIVVGRDGSDLQLIEEMINCRQDQPVKIYTQELFMAAILAHLDPFDELSAYSNPQQDYPELFEMVCRFGADHPVIQYLQNQQFPWPDSANIEDGNLNGDWLQVDRTPLVQMNYHVGELGLKMGLTESDRQAILESAYFGQIPWVESDEYMDSWGEPGTRKRLARIAYHLSMLIRSRKNLKNQTAARNNWQRDLNWLHGFYKPLMRFKWPI